MFWFIGPWSLHCTFWYCDICYSFLMTLSFGRYMGCSQILTVVNSAIIIMNMQVFLLCDGFDSFGIYPRVVRPVLMVILFFSFLRNFCTGLHSGWTNLYSWHFFLYMLMNLYCFPGDGHPDGGKRISVWFWFVFAQWLKTLRIALMYLLVIFNFFVACLFRSFICLLIRLFVLLLFFEFFIYSGC